MDNGPNGCRSIAGQFFVSEECKLHTPAAEKVPGFKRMRKAKTTPRNLYATRRSVSARALQTHFMIAGNRKQIVGVLGDDPKSISGIQLAERKLFGVELPVAGSELLPV